MRQPGFGLHKGLLAACPTVSSADGAHQKGQWLVTTLFKQDARARSAIAAQGKYAAARSGGGKLGLTVPEAFVRGIRHIGYRSNVEAIAELIDNSIQAYAERIDLVFGYDGSTSSKKPRQLAIVDDGHGMAAEMMRLAMMWGGTHRENDRGGLGRYGYGLPCATVSIGRCFTIMSKLNGGRLNAVTLDLDALEAGNYRNADGDIALPATRPAQLPHFLQEHLGLAYPDGWPSGTIVLVEKLDRLEWTTSAGLRSNLARHFGVTYHKLLDQTAIYIDGAPVRPIDPLFLTEGRELHALDNDRAQALDPIVIRFESDGLFEGAGEITLRYAWLPPTFGAIDKSRDATGLNANARFAILKNYHGIVFSRNGRVIDLGARTPWTTFINNDRYIRVEIEFSAALDEQFGVTTSKQQVTVSPAMWDRLREAGLHKAIEHLRAKVRMAKTERTRVPKPNRTICETPLPLPKAHPASSSDVSNALESLLQCIDRRSRSGGVAIAAEYRSLLTEWSAIVVRA